MVAPPFFDDIGLERVLCVAAHPDDLEYGASAAVARWTSRDVTVSYLLLTAGEAGMRSRPPQEVAPLRAGEQRAACEAVGVEDLVILDLPDGALEASLEARRRIARRIRQFRPDAVLVPTWELEVAWGLNHADHRAAGLATVDAVRDADNPWVFPELREEGLEAWGTSRLLVTGTEPNHLVDISGEPFEKAVRSLEAHEAYLAALGDHMEPRTMLDDMTRVEGVDGVTHALGIRIFEL